MKPKNKNKTQRQYRNTIKIWNCRIFSVFLLFFFFIVVSTSFSSSSAELTESNNGWKLPDLYLIDHLSCEFVWCRENFFASFEYRNNKKFKKNCNISGLCSVCPRIPRFILFHYIFSSEYPLYSCIYAIICYNHLIYVKSMYWRWIYFDSFAAAR